MKNVSDKSCREARNTQFIFNNFFLSPENLAFHEIVWKNIVERGKPQMAIWYMRFACWVTKTTNTHSGYVVLSAVLLQQWSHESALVLLNTCIACLFAAVFVVSSPC